MRAWESEPAWEFGQVRLYEGNCVTVLAGCPAESIDAVVTDPPYGLGFMGEAWDTFEPERVATNTRKAMRAWRGKNVEDRGGHNPNVRGRRRSPAMSPSQVEYDRTLAGQRAFQAWCQVWASACLRVLKPGGYLLASGAPRSAHRLVCGIEDAGFEVRDSVAWLCGQGFPKSLNLGHPFEGWGTALKPGHEPIAVARKPFRGTVDANMKRNGVGAMNLRVGRAQGDRWPANVVLDELAAEEIDRQSGVLRSGANPTRRGSDKFRTVFGAFNGQAECVAVRGMESGGASRFFYTAKPSHRERESGCGPEGNPHPTVKPVSLMTWLVGLVTPPGGVVLDPFCGSGTTGMAAVGGGWQFVGVEQQPSYVRLAAARILSVRPLLQGDPRWPAPRP